MTNNEECIKLITPIYHSLLKINDSDAMFNFSMILESYAEDYGFMFCFDDEGMYVFFADRHEQWIDDFNMTVEYTVKDGYLIKQNGTYKRLQDYQLEPYFNYYLYQRKWLRPLL